MKPLRFLRTAFNYSGLYPGRRIGPALLIALLPLSAFANSPPEVSNVVAVQRPGSKLVDVTYDVNDSDGDLVSVSLFLSEDGGATFPIECVSVSGDLENVASGTGKRIVWDAGADYPEQQGTNYVVRVAAEDHYVPEGFASVPAGTFVMEDASSASACENEEHVVTLTRSFLLGETEVTNQQYLEAIQWAYDNGYVLPVSGATVYDLLDDTYAKLLDLESHADCEIQFDNGEFSLRDAGHGINPDHPIGEVSWYGAVRYCDWLSLQEGLPRAYEHDGDWSCNNGDPYEAEGYRLPTEAEWEYAAQFDDDRLYPWGNEAPSCARANYGNPDPCVDWVTSVGSYPAAPSALGLFDMAGNAYEWCNDWFVCFLGTSPETDPVGPESGLQRIVRGGGYSSNYNGLRCAHRSKTAPTWTNAGVGFRVARTVSP